MDEGIVVEEASSIFVVVTHDGVHAHCIGELELDPFVSWVLGGIQDEAEGEK